MPPRKRTAKPERAKRRILIVDDHPLVRRGLTALINAEPDLVVCAEAANSRDGLAAIADASPDLVIADLSLGDSDGLDLVRQIRSRRGACYRPARVRGPRARLCRQAGNDRDLAYRDPQRAAWRDLRGARSLTRAARLAN
jgi:CheY-like chemotaxis protein